MQPANLMLPPTSIPRKEKQSPDPDADTDSLVQPGRRVLDYQLPPELPGTLELAGTSVGEGSFATVFKGVLLSPEGEKRTVAIKRVKLPGAGISHDQFRTRIKRETVIWTTAAHPNILPFIGYQFVDNTPMLVSPWCENGNLSTYIYKNPALTRNEKIDLLCHAARGLLHLHNLDPQVVHGDIKPENVIVQDNLVAALCDFGISKIHVEQHTGLTTSGKTGGTSGYQAKELLGEDPATPATDVYAFGGLILAAMSGKQPFWNKKPSSTIIAVFQDKTPARPDHPQLPANDPLWNLLLTCWSGEPLRRPHMSKVLETVSFHSR
ncbi:hypothetical protein M407DRAFT_114195 [Tulasnella calospora MUT 4182]|uniref:Protein kinase domain-containing protein n=1 Tax=Tulasnella calospora MUT 4182 TaxID=1051891 RepID=A0A0C3Q2Y2_9AGAM|nr:hypothetical protein M407DRAFT_114195 [Tulasnella calospora MUT 4182]